MKRRAQTFTPGPGRRRYLVHLCFVHDEGSSACRYAARIQLWTTRSSAQVKTQQRVFADEYELIETINPLLPHGSDVRNIISHIESPDGFLYLLYLSSEEAGSLGWRQESRSSDHEVQA
jgi:hypothetical protein